MYGPCPTDRWDPEGLTSDDPDAKGTIRCAQGGFIDKVDQFDAKFFNVSPKEADFIDPQQRLALEVAWEALEDAAIDPARAAPRQQRRLHGRQRPGLRRWRWLRYSYEELDTYMATGVRVQRAVRPAVVLPWLARPCISVDTACSSSLVAVHLAAQGLRAGESDIALCGGVNTIHSPRAYIVVLSNGNMLAPDGLCKTFDDVCRWLLPQPRAAVSSSSSDCPTPGATATGSTPWCGARRSGRTARASA